MNKNNRCSFSNELISYFIGEASEKELMIMKMHLLTCSSCSKDIQEMQEAWTMLPYELDEVEVPVDLKDEVMNAIFPSGNTSQPTLEMISPTVKTKGFVRIRQTLYGFTAAILLLSLGGAIWNNINLRDQVTELREQVNMSPEVIQVYTLKTANSASDNAQGHAFLYQQGENKQLLVFQLKGLTNTKGTEAYQVWLIHDGNRQSAGTFHVDKQGNGILTYQLKEEQSFDAIGVSLEPDANGTQPRGKKVLGT